mmetsp:Transcript_16133/g.46667  ORF Transcript_16133/g.46667 Transcript_16133/m.46667 type:complete len:291 (-) Transcript_16133:15-887(-)
MTRASSDGTTRLMYVLGSYAQAQPYCALHESRGVLAWGRLCHRSEALQARWLPEQHGAGRCLPRVLHELSACVRVVRRLGNLRLSHQFLDASWLNDARTRPGRRRLPLLAPWAADALDRRDDDIARLRRRRTVEWQTVAHSVEQLQIGQRAEIHKGVAKIRLPRRIARDVDRIELPLEPEPVQCLRDALLRAPAEQVLDHRGARPIALAPAHVQAAARLLVGTVGAVEGRGGRLIVVVRRDLVEVPSRCFALTLIAVQNERTSLGDGVSHGNEREHWLSQKRDSARHAMT